MLAVLSIYPPRSHSKERLSVKSVQSYARSWTLCARTHTHTHKLLCWQWEGRWVYSWLLYASLLFSDRYWATAETWFHLLSVSCGCYLHLFRAVTGCSQLSVQQQWGIWREQQRCEQKMAGADSSHWSFTELPVSSLPHRGKMKSCGIPQVCLYLPVWFCATQHSQSCGTCYLHSSSIFRLSLLQTLEISSADNQVPIFLIWSYSSAHKKWPIVTLEHYRKHSAFIFGTMLLHLEVLGPSSWWHECPLPSRGEDTHLPNRQESSEYCRSSDKEIQCSLSLRSVVLGLEASRLRRKAVLA